MNFGISTADWLNIAINFVLPAVVAVVTSRLASGGVKAVVLLALSAISGFLVSWLDASNNGLPFDFSQAGVTVLVGFAVAVLAHFGLFKPLAITGRDGAIQARLPRGFRGFARGRHRV